MRRFVFIGSSLAWMAAMAGLATLGPLGRYPLVSGVLYSAAFGFLILMVRWFPDTTAPLKALGVVFLLGIAARSLFLTYPVGNDVYRYVWEGYVQNFGVNPYRMAPDNPALAEMARTGLQTVWENINHKNFAAVYPPLSLLLFRFLAAFNPDPFFFKFCFIGFDLGVMVVLALMCRLRRVPASLLAAVCGQPAGDRLHRRGRSPGRCAGFFSLPGFIHPVQRPCCDGVFYDRPLCHDQVPGGRRPAVFDHAEELEGLISLPDSGLSVSIVQRRRLACVPFPGTVRTEHALQRFAHLHIAARIARAAGGAGCRIAAGRNAGLDFSGGARKAAERLPGHWCRAALPADAASLVPGHDLAVSGLLPVGRMDLSAGGRGTDLPGSGSRAGDRHLSGNSLDQAHRIWSLFRSPVLRDF